MKKQKGFGLIRVLLIISALLLTAGRVVVWLNQRRPSIPDPQFISPSSKLPTQVNPTATSFIRHQACVLEPKAGSCLAKIMKFFYDQSMQRCRPFSWGGCSGVVPFETLEECQSLCESKIQDPSSKVPDSVKQKIVQIKEALAADENDVSHLSDPLVQVSPEGNLLLEYYSATLMDETKKEDLDKFGNIVGERNFARVVTIWISHYQVENAARLSWVSAVRPVNKTQPD